MSNFKNYVSESYEELKNHVTWPTWAEGQKLMVIVAVFSILFRSPFGELMRFLAQLLSNILIGLNHNTCQKQA